MTFLYILIGLVLVFDFINGFHDSANSIATVVSTKVLSPLAAVRMAAFFNFVAIALGTLTGGWRIVKTIGQKITKLKPFEGFFDLPHSSYDTCTILKNL
jgi:PiT family inorganic phosphate transporter